MLIGNKEWKIFLEMNVNNMNHKKFFKANLFVSVMCLFTVILIVPACNKNDNTYRNAKPTAGEFKGNGLQFLQSQPGVYDSMLLVLSRLPRIADSISTKAVTFFGVSNRSFSLALQNINQARQDSIPSMPQVSFATIDSAVLDTFMCRYVLEGRHLSDDLADFADGLFFPTIHYTNRNGTDTSYSMQMQYVRTNASGFVGGGPKAITLSDPKGSIFFRYWVRVNTITVDIKTSNAIVYLLPAGHDFGFGDEFIREVNVR